MRFAYFTVRRFLTVVLGALAVLLSGVGYAAVASSSTVPTTAAIVRHYQSPVITEFPAQPPEPQSLGTPRADVAFAEQQAFIATVAAEHRFHLEHEAHERYLAEVAARVQAAKAASIASDTAPAKAPAPSAPAPTRFSTPVTVSASGCSDPSGQLTQSQIGMLWLCAGGPSWAESSAEAISRCESGWNTHAYNPSGASGLWQILGQVVGGYIFDAHVNALNAVAKFRASGNTWAQWVCQALPD